MGFARKAKRKLSVGLKAGLKKAEDSETRRQKTEMLSMKKAQKLLKDNAPLIQEFTNCYWRVCTDYLMHKDFGWGYERLKRLNKERDVYYWMLNYNDPVKPHPEWCDTAGWREALWDECGVVCNKRERMTEPEEKTVEGYLQMKAHNAKYQVSDDIEITLLWTLHTKFGFGKNRLNKVVRSMATLTDLPSQTFNAVLDEMDSAFCVKVDGEKKYINYKKCHKIMDLLTMDGIHPCDEFPLMMGGIA